MSSAVSREPAADSAQALQHFSRLLQFETDCWDVHHAMSNNKQDFILLDVRMPPELEMMKLPYDNVVHIPLGKLREKAGELPTDKEIVCLCKISLRGYEAARILIGHGINPANISFLDGGVVAWPYEKIVK